MLSSISSLQVFAVLATIQLALAETGLRHSAWHDGLVGCALGLTLGMAIFAKRMQGSGERSADTSYRVTP